MKIIAHRGSSHAAPENTLEAAALAWREGADGLECDVRLTQDGRVVVIHDDRTRRTLGRAGRVSRMAFDDLRLLDAGRWKGQRFAGSRIPLLDEWLATGDGEFLIEIKCGAEILKELARTIRDSGKPPGKVVLIAFNRDLLFTAKLLLPSVRAFWIVDYGIGVGRARNLADVIRRCKEVGLDGLDLGTRWPLDVRSVETVKSAGLELYVWTVDRVAGARRLCELGADGVTTNRPGLLRAAFGAL